MKRRFVTIYWKVSGLKMSTFLYIPCQIRNEDLDELFKHENQECHPSVSQHSIIRLGTKTDFMHWMKGFATLHKDIPNVSDIILDSAKTFAEHATKVSLPYIKDSYNILIDWT